MANKKYKPDDKDWQIITLLRAGTISNSTIAQELGVSEGMIRQRIKRLREYDILSLRGLINPDILGNSQIVMVAANISESSLLEATAEAIEKLEKVLSVSIVSGRYDIIIELLIDSNRGLIDFLSKDLSQVPHIKNTESFVLLKNYSKFV
jgi:Lrp/AsnC family transcriptional regulator, regulator for asnA, asnC and gidA